MLIEKFAEVSQFKSRQIPAMPKNAKAKMHNKLMKAKEVYKSAPIIGKTKIVAKNGHTSMKAIDAQLLQMKERQYRQSKTNIAGKAAPKAMLIQLQPSLIGQAQTSVAVAAPLYSLTDLLLEGEGNMPVPKSVGQSTTIDGYCPPRRKANMFADLSDDDEDANSKYQLKLQPSLLLSTASLVGKSCSRNSVFDNGSDDDDL